MAVKKELRAIISAEDRKYQRTMAKVKKTAMDVGRSIAQIGIAGGVAFLAGSKIALDYADNIDKVAQRLGLTTDEYQRLALAAAQAGMSQEQFNVGMQALTKNIGGALNGQMEQVRALGQIGIKLRDIRGKSAQEQLLMVGDALSEVADQNKRMKLAGQLFGDEAGARVMVMFAKGAKGVADAMNRIDGESLLTQEQIQNATKLNDQLTVTKAVLMGGLAKLLSDTWPVMQDGIAGATAELQLFLRSADFAAMRDGLGSIVTDLAALGREIIPLVKTGMEGLSEINAFAKPIEGLKELIGLFNDVNEAIDNLSDDSLDSPIKTGPANQSMGGKAGDALNQIGAGAYLAADDQIGNVTYGLGPRVNTRKFNNGGDMDRLLEFLRKGPLGEGK